MNKQRKRLKLDGLLARDLMPAPCPMRAVPDYDALIQRMVDNGGWTVIQTDPSEDRPNSATIRTPVSPLVKAINAHVRIIRKRPLYIRRLASDAWYLELGEEQ